MSDSKKSLTLLGAVSMGTGVMIGAGIFALTGQIAELANALFPLAFLTGMIVTSICAYSYIKLSQNYPSSGGIAMFLQKAYGKGATTAIFALLMFFSMIINQSLVARTFGTYTLQLFEIEQLGQWAVPLLGALLLVFAFLINIIGNKYIERLSVVMAFIKAIGLFLLALGGLWAAGFDFNSLFDTANRSQLTDNLNIDPAWGFISAVALSVLAYKGFTTITNSGDELTEPKKNIPRAIAIAIGICTFVYLLVAVSVSSNLSIPEIVSARDYSLAEAARPAFGQWGLTITVLFAIVATVSGVIASIFAVSRMLTMLTDMKLVPHSHLGMPGNIQKHNVVYTVVIAMFLTLFFDLSRIASMGVIFYIIMDIAIHWGVLVKLRKDVGANPMIVLTAIALDVIILSVFLWIKWQMDPFVIWASLIGLSLIVAGELIFLRVLKNKTQ
ncbi:amino acid permease [Kangiella profundi]|uniref:Amino acid permease n=1 Tax=Kangiella profundi TaxID=1561924 RepID=A0A2K9A7W5_9GAMM|nr:APC family permease [Kangiella profundi]AUD78810.1 amino acid permease [Kangiella profundi]GGF03995.1 amino acid permease [Kangiella profundi]